MSHLENFNACAACVFVQDLQGVTKDITAEKYGTPDLSIDLGAKPDTYTV